MDIRGENDRGACANRGQAGGYIEREAWQTRELVSEREGGKGRGNNEIGPFPFAGRGTHAGGRTVGLTRGSLSVCGLTEVEQIVTVRLPFCRLVSV